MPFGPEIKGLSWGALLLAAACGGAPDFAATRPVPLRVEGFDLDVYRAGDNVRVVDATPRFRSEGDFVYTAVRAAERVTGCAIRRNSLHGGPRRIEGRLDC